MSRAHLYPLACVCVAIAWAADVRADGPTCVINGLRAAVDNRPIPDDPDLKFYEAYRVLGLKPEANLNQFEPQTGIFLKRDASGKVLRNPDGSPVEAKMRVLTDNPGDKVYVVGDFNNWGNGLSAQDLAKYELKSVPGTRYHEGVVPGLKHGQQYRLVVNGKQVIDPSAELYNTPEFQQKFYGNNDYHLNSIFWDFDRPDSYKPQVAGPDLRRVHVSIGEVEPWGLVHKFPRPDGSGEGPARVSDTWAYIGDSKTQLASSFKEDFQYNAAHMLPINQSIEGDPWQYRYQVYGNFAENSRYGTPDEAAKAVDEFHRQGVGVVIDYLGSHFPFKGPLSDVGLQNWYKENGQHLFARNGTEWGTYRYDYENPFVRRFLIDGALQMFKRYNIDGLRIDNVGGILGEPGGREFLRELAAEIHKYRPDAYIQSEDFFGNDRTQSVTQGGLGANARNGNMYFGWVRDNAQKRADELDMNGLRASMRDPWQWHEMAQAPYDTNHDESANRTNGATGAYFVSLVDGGGNFHSYGKARVFTSLALGMMGYSEDTPQLRVMQRGSLNYNPDVEWSRLNDPEVKNSSRFLAAYTRYLNEQPAAAFENVHPNIENHTDYDNKLVSTLRIDRATGKKIYTLYNLTPNSFTNYQFGVDASGSFKLRLDSDSKDFGGSDRLESATNGAVPISNNGMHGKSHSVNLPYVAPYSVIVLEQ